MIAPSKRTDMPDLNELVERKFVFARNPTSAHVVIGIYEISMDF